jgi:hypothetical protein
MRSAAALAEVVRPFYTRASPALLALEPSDPSLDEPETKLSGWNTFYLHLESRIAAYTNWRVSWWQHWAEIARYQLPRRYHAFITANTYDRGLRRDGLIIDETATLAGQTCATGMMSGLTDPDRPWYKIGPGQPGVELDRLGQIWFDDVTDRLRYVQAESNFYDSLAQAYEDMTFFGNGVVIDYEHDENIMHSYNYCAGEYFLGAGFDFTDEVLYAEFRLTVNQLVERFGLDNCSGEVKQAWFQKGAALEGEFVVGHAIEPNFAVRDDRNSDCGVVPGGFAWREVFWLRGKPGTSPLSVAGFREKPFSVMRWNTVSNDPYARGPGSDALGATIQLQLETARKAEAIEKVVRPPMGADPSLLNAPTSTRPDGVTYVNTANGKPTFYPLYEIRPDLPAITADITQIQERIGRIYFNNLFRMVESLRESVHGEVTATEIDALKAEQLVQLGPVIGRVLGAIRQRITRQLAIMERRGLIPPKPESIRRLGTKIEFISMLTMAQRATATVAIQRAFAFAQSIQPVYPKAVFNLDENEATREMADLLGVPARIIRAPRLVEQMSQNYDKQQQAAQAAQFATAGVQGAQALGRANVTPDTALGRIVGPGQAPQGNA